MLLSDTYLANVENLESPNFGCMVQFKQPDVKNDEIAMYHNSITHADVNFVKEHVRL